MKIFVLKYTAKCGALAKTGLIGCNLTSKHRGGST